jgi:hypothetical protein
LSDTTRAWLFVRGVESVRIVSDGTSISVYGPGDRFSQSTFSEQLGAALHQAALESALVMEGWSLEQLTTERRSPLQSAKPVRERRGPLRLIRSV